MSHTHTNLIYHIVFSTKDRQPLLGPHVRPRICRYLGGGIRGEGGIALIVNGTVDHVHILAKSHQDKAVADVVRAVKANSSGWIHRTFPKMRAFAWQVGYGAFTVSASQVEKARRYITNQEKHHRRRGFKEEYIALLKAHEIEFDEEELWT